MVVLYGRCSICGLVRLVHWYVRRGLTLRLCEECYRREQAKEQATYREVRR